MSTVMPRRHRPLLLPAILLLAGCPTRPRYDEAPTIAITSPSPNTYTNGVLQIALAVTGEPSIPVTLLQDGIAITELFPPYTMAWDTKLLADGPHTLGAELRYAEETIRAPSITVHVDHTPPTVRSMTPMPGSTDVVLRAPAVVEFSEPILVSSLPASSVTVGSTAVDYTIVASPDGTTFTLTVDAASRRTVSLPATFSVRLSGITDRAGNSLVLPALPWSWTVPDWVKLPKLTTSGPIKLAVGADHRPVLLRGKYVQMGMGGSTELGVSKYDGQKWVEYDAVSTNPASNSGLHGFSVDMAPDGEPVVAWTDQFDAGRVVRVSSRQGAAWMTLPPLQYRSSALEVKDPVVKLDEAARPVVAWRERASDVVTGLHVARWDGTQWTQSFTGLGFISAGAHDLLLKDGSPLLAWRSEYGLGVSVWNGIDWQRSSSLGGLAEPFAVLSSTGNPMMVYTDGASPIRVSLLNGTAWGPAVDKPVPASASAMSPRLAIGPDAAPVVAWADSMDPRARIGFARWTGTDWDARAGLFNEMYRPDRAPELVVDDQGTVWVAWSEQSGASVNVWMSNY